MGVHSEENRGRLPLNGYCKRTSSRVEGEVVVDNTSKRCRKVTIVHEGILDTHNNRQWMVYRWTFEEWSLGHSRLGFGKMVQVEVMVAMAVYVGVLPGPGLNV